MCGKDVYKLLNCECYVLFVFKVYVLFVISVDKGVVCDLVKFEELS